MVSEDTEENKNAIDEDNNTILLDSAGEIMKGNLSSLLLQCTDCFKFAAFFSYNWRFGEFTCKAIYYVQNLSAICSVATLTFMSLERYYAIVHPMRAKYVCTKGRARRAITILWIGSVVLAVPILIGRIQLTVGRRRQAKWCVKWFEDKLVRQLYEVYMFSLILIVPVCIMSFAYFRICQELWFMAKHRSNMRSAADFRSSQYYGRNGSSNSTPVRNSSANEKTPVLRVKFTDDDTTKKQVIKMLVAVVVVFIICWAPILINNVLVAFEFLPELNIPPYKYMREAFHLLSYANSCVNPIVYGFMSRNFRQTFKRALCSCLKGRQYVRKMTFKNQSLVVNEKWDCRTGKRQCEVEYNTSCADGCTDIFEMSNTRHERSSSEDIARL
ncbi:CCKAR-like protein [Mya arenaria]|uniref:CCKAR-like protein n=1 Tax=Mya arenaria TaxID=6604 RepID=A0ABY7FR91_MYAAR|nr:CCKAR-like protein [Mya arenaria]